MSLPLSEVNLLAALLATIVSMGIGMAWYSRALFGTQWMALTGITEADMKKADMKKAFGTGAVASFIASYFIGVLLLMVGTSDLKAAFGVGVVVWVAKELSNELHGVAWESRPVKLVCINAAGGLVTTLAQAGVMQSW